MADPENESGAGAGQEQDCFGIIPNPPDGGISSWAQFTKATRSANQSLRASFGSNLDHFTVASALRRGMRIADMKKRVQAGQKLPKNATEEQKAAAKLLTDKFAEFTVQLDNIDRQLEKWVDENNFGDLGEQQPPRTGHALNDTEAKIGKLGPPLPAWQVCVHQSWCFFISHHFAPFTPPLLAGPG